MRTRGRERVCHDRRDKSEREGGNNEGDPGRSGAEPQGGIPGEPPGCEDGEPGGLLPRDAGAPGRSNSFTGVPGRARPRGPALGAASPHGDVAASPRVRRPLRRRALRRRPVARVPAGESIWPPSPVTGMHGGAASLNGARGAVERNACISCCTCDGAGVARQCRLPADEVRRRSGPLR